MTPNLCDEYVKINVIDHTELNDISIEMAKDNNAHVHNGVDLKIIDGHVLMNPFLNISETYQKYMTCEKRSELKQK